MKIRTNEKTVDLQWVRAELSLCLLDEHNDVEMVTVENVKGHTIFVCSFASLKVAARNHATARRVENTTALRDPFRITAFS